jgi:hypothetical protein
VVPAKFCQGTGCDAPHRLERFRLLRTVSTSAFCLNGSSQSCNTRYYRHFNKTLVGAMSKNMPQESSRCLRFGPCTSVVMMGDLFSRGRDNILDVLRLSRYLSAPKWASRHRAVAHNENDLLLPSEQAKAGPCGGQPLNVGRRMMVQENGPRGVMESGTRHLRHKGRCGSSPSFTANQMMFTYYTEYKHTRKRRIKCIPRQEWTWIECSFIVHCTPYSFKVLAHSW